MRKVLFKSILIILLAEFFLLGFSLLYSQQKQTTQQGLHNIVNYFTWNELFDFSIRKRNQKADTIIRSLATTEQVSLTADTLIPKSIVIDTVVSMMDTSAYLTNTIVSTGEHALDHFYNALYVCNDTDVLRIAHYGDSQLEGDRLTCFIRKEFQKRFGGYGIGYLPLTDITTHQHMIRSNSDNWIRYNVFNKRYTNGMYSASGLLFKIDEQQTDPATEKFATTTLELYKTFNYEKVNILYKAQEPFRVDVMNSKNGNVIASDSIMPAKEFSVVSIPVPANYRSLKLAFSAVKSPELYGLQFEGKGGIQMDNYAIRGHSGERMSYADAGFIAYQLKLINTKLIVLQYGANVVPYFDNQTKCDYLEKVYYSLFMRYKSSLKDVSILVIGPGDMAYASNGDYKSYENVGMVRDAQRRAAMRAGCAFWDMYEAMGGQGSVLTWSEKGMASRDGHFYISGQRIVARQLFEALMADYNNYLYRKTVKQQALAGH